MKSTTVVTSIDGAPDIAFEFDCDTFSAELEGARIHGEATSESGAARICLTSANGDVLADVTIHPRSHRNAVENATDVSSALMWSHWRYTRAEASK